MNRPGIIDRAKEALRVFRRGYPYGEKMLPFAWPSFRAVQPQWNMYDFNSYVEEGWSLNSVVYSSIMYKVRATATAPLRAYTGDEYYPQPLSPAHPLSQLLAKPNEHQTGTEFQALSYVYFNLSGNVFILKDRSEPGRLKLYPLRPDRIRILPSKGVPATVKAFIYVPEGQGVNDGLPILPRDMIHIKLPWPGDPLEGMGFGFSPLSAAAQVADVDNLVTKFLNVFFRKGSMITGVLKFDVPLQEDTVATIKERWQDIYGGVDKWGVGVLDRGGDYSRVGLTIEEMGFNELDARSECRITGPFGVPPILIGAKTGLERSTYSNYGEARKACWEDTLLPELKWFEAELQDHLNEGEAYVRYDTTRVPALQKDVPKQAVAAYTLWQMGVPADQALNAAGLRVGHFENDDKPYAGNEEAPTKPGGTQAPPSNEQGPRADPDEDGWGMNALAEAFEDKEFLDALREMRLVRNSS